MSRQIYTAKGTNVSGPYSHAVDAGETIYFSGQTAMNQEGAKDLTGDITAQTQIAFDNLWQVMEEVGLTEAHVKKVNVYLTSMDDFEAMNEVYAKQFSQPYPARTCIAVKELPLGAQVEIEWIAKRS